MARPDVLRTPPANARAVLSRQAENRLVRAVGRVPVTVRTKLLVAFAVIAALLVAVGALGLRVLGQSNARVVSLGTLQVRAGAYQSLQTQASQLRQMLGIRVAQAPSLNTFNAGSASGVFGGRSWTLVDKTIIAALSQVGRATSKTQLDFVPAPEDEVLLERIRLEYRRFSRALERMIVFDRAGTTSKRTRPFLSAAITADNALGALTDQLASRTRAQTDALITESDSAYASSRNLFVVVAVASIALAALLGFVLSRSLVSPIRRIESRLAELAAGDFSRHVEVSNRDELGALAANLNRMNDELRRLYEELGSVSRHKSEFLANMSHELRTPLNAVIGFSELLEQQSAGELNARQLGYVEDVLEAGRHLLSLINDVLDLSKVEAGMMELTLSDVSLRAALESGLAMHVERATRGGIVLELTIDPNEITIRADERKLRQVVFNLLSNAVTFTPAGGHVDITAHVTGNVAEVGIADSGPGVAPEDQELIFEEFRQAGRANGGPNQGTGLGLPLSRKFIELHGGRLWVESIPGEGSTFRFTLPVGQAD